MQATKILARLLLAPVIVVMGSAAVFSQESFSPYVDAEGTIHFPEGFRTSMAHLGSWFVPSGAASGFHDVYTEKESVKYYRDKGEFPDGAVIVKELRASKSGDYTTGAGVHHSTDGLKQWFVMVKDTQNRFAGTTVSYRRASVQPEIPAAMMHAINICQCIKEKYHGNIRIQP